MITHWTELATKLGSLHANGESGGEDFTRRAFDDIPGGEWVDSAVEHIIPSDVTRTCYELPSILPFEKRQCMPIMFTNHQKENGLNEQFG